MDTGDPREHHDDLGREHITAIALKIYEHKGKHRHIVIQDPGKFTKKCAIALGKSHYGACNFNSMDVDNRGF